MPRLADNLTPDSPAPVEMAPLIRGTTRQRPAEGWPSSIRRGSERRDSDNHEDISSRGWTRHAIVGVLPRNPADDAGQPRPRHGARAGSQTRRPRAGPSLPSIAATGEDVSADGRHGL